MASKDSTPARELTDNELRRRLLALGYDVPVSVNRDFLIAKLEKASAGNGGGGKVNKRHTMAASPSSSPAPPSPNTTRKRKSIATTPASNTNASSNRGHLQNSINSTPMSTPPPTTPTQHYSPASSISTPPTPSPFVSRLNTPSPPSSPVNNGETGSHSPRYLNYYNFFKSSGEGGNSGDAGSGGGGGAYGYGYNRSIRYSAPPGSFNPVTSVAPPTRATDRNGYATGGATGSLPGVESDWCGSHFISKILVVSFILFFAIIAGLYWKQNYFTTTDPSKALPGAVGNAAGGVNVKESQPPPPPKPKKIEKPQPPTSMIYPICGLPNVDLNACIPKEVVKNSRTLFQTLKDELTQRARMKGCYSDVQEVVSLQEAKAVLYKLTDLRKSEVDAAFQGMLLLITENHRAGLSLASEAFSEAEISSKDVIGLDQALAKVWATNVNPDFLCEARAFLSSVALVLTVAVGGIGAAYCGWKGVVYYRKKKKSEEDEVFKIVEKVQEILFRQYELSEENSQGTAFLAVNHIRDELVPPKERQKKEALWNKVVEYISNHESRIREEIQHISGEEFKVWRWLPSASPLTSKRFSTANHNRNRFSMPAMGSPPMTSTPVYGMASAAEPVDGPAVSPLRKSLYPNLNELGCDEDNDMSGGQVNGSGDANSNKWQGQAFETCEGSPNALPSTPTTCLKIRHMFTDRDATARDRSRIEKEILSKCRNSKILHIGIDSASVEGCVYIRCVSKEDARTAFLSLHGWWFDGHLLSVKFLREERYFSRFPEAKHCRDQLHLPR